jgi:hypothetical protein
VSMSVQEFETTLISMRTAAKSAAEAAQQYEKTAKREYLEDIRGSSRVVTECAAALQEWNS